MSKQVNIDPNNSDASYRYKMPSLQTKIKGRGNGIQTVVINIHEVSRALRVLPAYPTKFFGLELGAQSTCKENCAIINGAHSVQTLSKLLNKYIEIFVLCPTCKLPETTISISSKDAIEMDCAACGYNGLLKTAHKLANFILKHPPEQKSQPKKTKEEESSHPQQKEGKVQWISDTSKAAVQKRREEELATFSKKTDEKSSSSSPVASLKSYIDTHKDASPTEISIELARLVPNQNQITQRFCVLIDSVIDFEKTSTLLEQFKTHLPLWKKVVSASLADQKAMCCALEQRIPLKFVRYAPHIFQNFYNSDILAEDAILAWWGNNSSNTPVGKQVEPLIQWLVTAEEEQDG
jgi:translation initiation factor 5